MSTNIAITAWGSAFGDNNVTNDELAQRLEVTPEWIVDHSGISSRPHASKDTTLVDLAVAASRDCLAKVSSPPQVDMILVATLSSDYAFPGVASFVQHQLFPGSSIPALDLKAQCSGFVYAMATAHGLLSANPSWQNILVVGAEIHSHYLNLSSGGKDQAILFGDGAGAVLVSKHHATLPVQAQSYLGGDGSFALDLSFKHLPTDGSANTPAYPRMKGRNVILNAKKRLSESIDTLLKQSQLTLDTVDYIIPHQANGKLLEALANDYPNAKHKFINTIATTGNTSAASIPIALGQAITHGTINTDSPKTLLLVGFGSGFTWGSHLVTLAKGGSSVT